jgi:hypothetical protein
MKRKCLTVSKEATMLNALFGNFSFPSPSEENYRALASST